MKENSLTDLLLERVNQEKNQVFDWFFEGKNIYLIEVLKSFNLGGINKNVFYLNNILHRNTYHKLLESVIRTIYTYRGSDVPIDYYKVLYTEHIFQFGYANLTKSESRWINLCNNFRLINEEELFLGEETDPTIIGLIEPIKNLERKEFSNTDFLDFYGKVIDSTYNRKGYQLTYRKGYLYTEVDGILVCVFPFRKDSSDRFHTIVNTLRVVSVYEKNRRLESRGRIDDFFREFGGIQP